MSHPPAQPDLFDLSTIESVQGYGALGRRERLFAEALFEGRTQRAAAEQAGITGTPEVVDAAASRLVRSVKLQRVMAQAWARSGASIDTTLRQAAELQARAFLQAAQGDSCDARKEAFKQWREASTLIASIHGKLRVQIEGQLSHEHSLVIPPEALGALAQMRRDVVALREAGV